MCPSAPPRDVVDAICECYIDPGPKRPLESLSQFVCTSAPVYITIDAARVVAARMLAIDRDVQMWKDYTYNAVVELCTYGKERGLGIVDAVDAILAQ